MKKKHLYLLIATLTVAAVLPIIILVCFSSANEPQRPVTINYRNTEYAYKEQPTCDYSLEGIAEYRRKIYNA